MKTGGKIRKGYLLALGVLLFLPGLKIMQAQAAREVVLDQECSLTVSVEIGSSAGGNDAYLEDLNRMTIPVSVYRVADVDLTGQNYSPTEAFREMDFSKIRGNSSSVTAEMWQTLAEQAKQIQESARLQEDGAAVIQPVQESRGAAYGKIAGLMPGLYLVVPEASYNPEYTVQYVFTPYLTALPDSVYTLEGEGSDEWNYDTVIGLKPDAEPQFGKLNITKVLQNYNTSLGQATFVFRITGTDKNGGVKYEEVESMTYTAAGSNTITLEKIPAGLTVKVEEIYSGASYTADGSKEETVLIASDAAVAAGEEEASVTFRNRYNGGNRGGYGVKNHFESDGAGGWIWENPTSQAGQ